MLHTIGTRRKFKTASERLTGPQHSQKWQPKHQRKEDADDDGPAHVSDLYSRPSSSSITSAQVVTGGKELIDVPRLLAMSCIRPWNRWWAASAFGPEARRFLLHW